MTTPKVHLCLVLHNHQPIGNFEGVFQQAYEDSYLPFLDVFEPYEHLRISLHTSGPLMMWLAEHHPEYLDRLRALVETDRVEILGGPQYEPILTMLPRRDRVGQIVAYSAWLRRHLGASVNGMWTPERVWESNLAGDITQAGIRYTVLDDFHFHAAGCTKDKLTGYFLTEEDGRTMYVFPGSEYLRYKIPFADPSETIEHCRQMAEQFPGAVLTFGDDGEKFGTWPNTKHHVYEQGWLRRFFDALSANADWLCTSTLANAIRHTRPVGKIYLPDCSYREMTEWSLPAEQQECFDNIVHQMETDERWPQLRAFVRGGIWRNFRVKYAEANEMYARMMNVSERLAITKQLKVDGNILNLAQDHLYRGQCNCTYWHGAFGGIYLPHLRNAIYRHLITADSILESIQHPDQQIWVEATADDYDFDGQHEVRLANDRMLAWIAPAKGGRLYEWDIREIAHNLLATMQRRPESYHQKVLAGPSSSESNADSIHNLVVFKQEGLEERLQYDRFPRKSMMDHFYDDDTNLEAIRRCSAEERGDFVDLPFDAKLRRASDRVQVQMCRRGNAWGTPLTITKAVTLAAGYNILDITYLLEDLPQDRSFHFGIEFNFAGLPAGVDDRFFRDAAGDRLGQLGEAQDLQQTTGLSLVDQWLGVSVGLEIDRSSDIWAFPIETVSQSESGFELVHQSVCVQPHWHVRGDADGRWAVKILLRADCSDRQAIELDEQAQVVISS